MIDYIQTHQSGFWIAVGFALLASEVLLFGFTTIIFLFAGIGALITGLLMSAGVLNETWIAGVSCFGISTGIASVLLWKPMSKLQGNNLPARSQSQSSDLIGHEFVLQEGVTHTSHGQYRYSGVDWKVELDASAGVDGLSAGQRVAVASVDAGIFRVKPV
ncbi:MAG: NfeD family protein [Gammaproteobacteria bacterium]|nr:NfeD family protein [Gammaproteobacteria bacterium]MCW8922448.1 NfeD family protein [Gammaproteobacteria bacterium]